MLAEVPCVQANHARRIDKPLAPQSDASEKDQTRVDWMIVRFPIRGHRCSHFVRSGD
jgi:hypothetical protein